MKTVAFIGQRGFPAEFPGTSGVEFYVENKITTLIRANKVIVYTRNWTGSRKININGLQIISVPTINTKHLDTIVYSLLATIHSCVFTDAQIVWYQGSGPGIFAFIPKLLGKKVILTIHSLDWKRDKWGRRASWFLRLSERVAIECADKVYCVAKHLQTYVVTTYHKPTSLDRIRQRKLINVEQETTRRVLMKYGLVPKKYILYLGRFVPEKRIEWLIKAFLELKRTGLKLVLAGGESHSQDYALYLQKMVNNNKNIVFTGYVFGEKKSALLANTKLFVLPSGLEGFPVAVIEALEHKCHCLVSNQLKNEYPKRANVQYFRAESFMDFVGQFNKTLGYRNP